MAAILNVAETGSTNDDVAALAREGAPEGVWLRAGRQTGGKGRQGRAWVSPPGNLYASTLVRLRPSDPPAPTLALVAAVALHEAVSLHAVGVSIKWPNDLVAFPPRDGDGGEGGSACWGHAESRNRLRSSRRAKRGGGGAAKLAGILLERAGDAVVIGFGVNLAHHPHDLDRLATSIAELSGAAPAPGDMLQALADVFARGLGRWRGEGLAPIRRAWLAAAHPVGTALRAAGEEGLFDGLDETGALRLRLADGSTRVVHAGDVFLV